jgi:hypothetical protein
MTSQFLSVKKLTGKDIILLAAKHNHREFPEYGDGKNSNIDPARIADNVLLRGIETAAGVAGVAQSLMKNADIKTVRKDAVRALEIIFSLPPESAISHEDFFNHAIEWTEHYFQAPIISAVIHNDEGAPHCHVLLLPLVDGRMNGSAMLGGKAKLQAMHANFHERVGKRHGMLRCAPKPRQSAAKREQAAAQLFAEIVANPSLLSQPCIAAQLIKAIAHDPEPLNLAMEQRPAPAQKPAAIRANIPAPCRHMNPIGFDDIKPIGFAPTVQRGNHQSLSCVGFGPRPAPAKGNAVARRAGLAGYADQVPAAFRADHLPAPSLAGPDAARPARPAPASAPAPAKGHAVARRAGLAGYANHVPAAFRADQLPAPSIAEPDAARPATPAPAKGNAVARRAGLAGYAVQAPAAFRADHLPAPLIAEPDTARPPAPANAPAPAKGNAMARRAGLAGHADQVPAAFNADPLPGPATTKPDAARPPAPANAPAPAKGNAVAWRAGLKGDTASKPVTSLVSPVTSPVSPVTSPVTSHVRSPVTSPRPAPAKGNAAELMTMQRQRQRLSGLTSCQRHQLPDPMQHDCQRQHQRARRGG